jgi:hypothetical protein
MRRKLAWQFAILVGASLIAGCTPVTSPPPPRGPRTPETSASFSADPTRPSASPVRHSRSKPNSQKPNSGAERRAGFVNKYQQKCSNMPFPGLVIYTYRVHECWLSWYPGKRSEEFMYMLGYVPHSHRRTQVMLVGFVNEGVRVVPLRNGHGAATMKAFRRRCSVIGYGHSELRSYYEPFRRRFVSRCRWRS